MAGILLSPEYILRTGEINLPNGDFVRHAVKRAEIFTAGTSSFFAFRAG
jgi:hypothetical protein